VWCGDSPRDRGAADAEFTPRNNRLDGHTERSAKLTPDAERTNDTDAIGSADDGADAYIVTLSYGPDPPGTVGHGGEHFGYTSLAG
jgi:hypothetical protein